MPLGGYKHCQFDNKISREKKPSLIHRKHHCPVENVHPDLIKAANKELEELGENITVILELIRLSRKCHIKVFDYFVVKSLYQIDSPRRQGNCFIIYFPSSAWESR